MSSWNVYPAGKPAPFTSLLLVTLLLELSTLAGVLATSAGQQQHPTFTREPPSILDFSNSTGGRLDCAVEGGRGPSQPSDISWTFADGKPVSDIAGLRRTLANGSLLFAPFAAQEYRQDVHATVYRCRVVSGRNAIVSRDVRVRGVVLQTYEAQVYDEFVIKGNTAVLKCHIPTFVADYVTVTSWKQDDTIIHPSTDEGAKHSIMPTGELHIGDVQLSDAYPAYRCNTKHRLTNEERQSAAAGRLFVTYPLGSVPPRITDSKVSVTAREGSFVILPCVAQGYPLPEITWYVKREDDKTALLRMERKFQARYSGLRVGPVDSRDAAVYVCSANNTVGSEKVEIALTVIAPLSVYIQPSRKVVDLGQTAQFQCVTSGGPITSFQWLKNGKPLHGGAPERPPRELLQLERVERDDQGWYQCLISSDYDSAQAIAEVKLGDILPVLHYTFPENIINPGSQVSLQCVVAGSPQPDVVWTLDGTHVTSNERILVDDVVDSTGRVVSFLNISDIRSEDGGHYACVARNKAGEAKHAARVNVYGRPFIRGLPKMSVVAGQDFSILCPATGYPLTSVSWEKGGRELPVSHHQVVFPNGTLQVKGIQRALDAGKYTCIVRNGEGQMASRDFEVLILVPPHIIPFSFMDAYMLEGMLARITCVVGRGDLPLTFTWLKDGRLIGSELGVTLREFDEFSVVLTITSATSRHNGNYTCVATNPAGTANHTAQLTVNVPPRWVVEPKDADVVADRMVVLDCQVHGFPTPVVQWMKAVDNKPGEYKIPSLGDPTVRQMANGSLVLNKARASDAGQYLCRATNGIGAPLGMVIKVHVQVPVHFEMRSTNQTARRNEKAKIRCDARGEGPIQVTWKINGAPLLLQQFPRMTLQEIPSSTGLTSELNIMRADRKDTGSYTCTAINRYGRDELHIHLTVTEPPEPPGHFKVSEKSSRSITLSWIPPYDGNDPVTKYVVQYKLAFVPWLEKTVNFTVPGNELSTTMGGHFLPATNYHLRVVAINGVGSSEPSEVVTVTTQEEAPSGPPLDIKAESLGADAIKVTWKPPKPDLWNGQILGYYVGYKLYETSDQFNFETVESGAAGIGQSLQPQPISVNLTDLKKFTRYSLIVQAFNLVGTSPRSDELVVLTSEDVPNMPPDEVKCSPLSSQSLHISWDPVPGPGVNGVLQGYKVVYSPADEWYDKGPEVKITSGLKTVLSGLGKYTNYSVQVSGFTRVGDGIRSEPVFCMTSEDVPESPADIKVAVLSASAAMVTWKPPTRPNGDVIKYTIYKRTTDKDKEDIEKYVVPAKSLHYESSGLKKGARYEFWVTASTSLGEGQSTRVVVQAPLLGLEVPAKIMSFGGPVNVSWKGVLTLKCKAVGIPSPQREWRFRGQILSFTPRITTSGDGVSLIIQSVLVTDAGPYTCKAHNSYGYDEISYLVRILVPPSPPVLVVAAAAFHSLEMQWKSDHENEGPVTGYYLNYKRDFGEWERLLVDAYRRSHMLTNLDCGTRYHLYLVAKNRIGDGSPSEVVTTRTEGAAPTMPRKHAFIRESATFVTLHLDAWVSGCAILYFVVHYKMRSDATFRLVSNNVLLAQKEFIIPDLAPATWYQLRVTAHNNAGSTVAEYTFATLTPSGGSLPELADAAGMEDTGPFYYNVTTLVISVCCLVTSVILIGFICICCRQRVLRSSQDHIEIAPPHADARPRLSSETVKNISNSSSNYLLSNNSNNRQCKKPGLSTPTSELSGDINPYATSQIPGCYTRDSRIINQRLSPHVYPPLRDLQDIRQDGGTFPGTRKFSLQRLQQCPDSRYSTGYKTPSSSADDITMALTREIIDFGSHTWIARHPASLSAGDQNVPDLLDHGLESNSSAGSSPDLNSRGPTKPYEVSLRRRGSLSSGSDFITQETSFTFLQLPEIKTVHYLTGDPELSDTESELDILNRKKMSAFVRRNFPLTISAATP